MKPGSEAADDMTGFSFLIISIASI